MLDKEKQIEEMAFDVYTLDFCKHLEQEECDATTCCHCTAEALYNKGYRKETETIAEFKELVKKYLLDVGLYLNAVKNAFKYAENKMRKEDEGR